MDDLVKNMKINNFFILARYILHYYIYHNLILLTDPPSSRAKVNETLMLADSKKFNGFSRTWFAGSLEDLSDVTDYCCDNMRVRMEQKSRY